jgi:hypothetical protein
MDEVHNCMFCLRADGTQYVVEDIPNQAVNWLVELFPTEAPTPGVWVQVPRRLRPRGMAHAFFNAYAFLEALEEAINPNFRAHPTQESAQPFRPFTGRGRQLGEQ